MSDILCVLLISSSILDHLSTNDLELSAGYTHSLIFSVMFTILRHLLYRRRTVFLFTARIRLGMI